jgi:aquaporin Z
MFRKNKLAMVVSEFLGTGALALTVLAMSHSQLAVPYFVASAAGFTLVLMVVALAGISGAVFNPALTIGLWTVRKLRTVQALSYIAAQFAGAAVAWYVFAYFTKLHDVKNTGTFDMRVMFAEMLGTFVFAFCVAAAVYQRLSLGLKGLMIGGGLVAGALVASLGSAGILNPAVAFSLHQWGWGTYVLGSIVGAVIGFFVYSLLFVETEVAELEEAETERLEVVEVPAERPVVKTVAAQRTKAAARTKASTKSAPKSRTVSRKK